VAGTTLLGHLRELHERDEVLGRELARLAALEGEVQRIREQAAELSRLLERLPEERERLGRAVGEAQAELGRRAAEAGSAKELVERVAQTGDERSLREANRSLRRARDAMGIAQRSHAARQQALAELERRAREGEAEALSLGAAARDAAGRLEATARLSATGRAAPRDGLPGLANWASRARAGLFVVRAGLEREREPLLRQANELVSATIGEPLYAATVALALRRLEAHSQPA